MFYNKKTKTLAKKLIEKIDCENIKNVNFVEIDNIKYNIKIINDYISYIICEVSCIINNKEILFYLEQNFYEYISEYKNYCYSPIFKKVYCNPVLVKPTKCITKQTVYKKVNLD